MKIQDFVFIGILIFLLLRKQYKLSLFFGLLCFLFSIPLFSGWIFFTAERLTWYGGGFIFLGIIQLLSPLEIIKNINVDKILKTAIKYQKIINIVILLIITVNLGMVVLQNKKQYFIFDYWERFSNLKYLHDNSQYVSKNPKAGWIPDEYLFAYAGGAFLKGVNPTYIASGSAPLGKYLISLSILLTGNENIIMLFSCFATLLFMFLLGKQIFNNYLLSLLAPLLLSFETFFKNQLVYVPLLDLIQLPFLLGCFYFFNKGVKNIGSKKLLYFSLCNVFLGGFISVKFFITGFIIIGACYLVLLLKKDKNSLIIYTLTLPLSLFVLMASYFKVFLEGSTLRQFFGIQKWVFLYHQSKLILFFTIWPLIFFNRWYVWYGNKPVISDPQWQFTWPLLQSSVLIISVLYFLRKLKPKIELEVLLIWSLLYILFSSLGDASSRYLVIYFPVLYIIMIYSLVLVVAKFLKRNKEKQKYV